MIAVIFEVTDPERGKQEEYLQIARRATRTPG